MEVYPHSSWIILVDSTWPGGSEFPGSQKWAEPPPRHRQKLIPVFKPEPGETTRLRKLLGLWALEKSWLDWPGGTGAIYFISGPSSSSSSSSSPSPSPALLLIFIKCSYQYTTMLLPLCTITLLIFVGCSYHSSTVYHCIDAIVLWSFIGFYCRYTTILLPL